MFLLPLLLLAQLLSAEKFSIFPDMEKVSIAELRKGLQNGNFSSQELLQFYSKRIQKYDKNGPRLNSIIELNPNLKSEAMAADRKITDCRKLQQSNQRDACFKKLGPFHGLFILVKDNIATTDGTSTAAGSLALVGSIVPRDAEIVRRLRNAGAIIMGKAGLSEWANYRSYNMSDGWSARGGQVVNPYDPSVTPLGSSSGCGVSVAANLATACIGTETLGSIISPAMANVVYGFKPAPGNVSIDGIIPITSDNDVPGPLCRLNADCLEIHNTLASSNILARANAPIRVGVVLTDPKKFSKAFKRLRTNKVEIVQLDMAQEFYNDEELYIQMNLDAVFNCRFKDDLQSYLSTLKNTTIRTLSDVIQFNINNAKVEKMEEYGQDSFLVANSARTFKTNPRFCRRALKNLRKIGTSHPSYGIDTLLAKYKVDALISDIDTYYSGIMAGAAGYPVIAVPIGNEFGSSLQITTRTGREQVLFQLGGIMEGLRIPPSLN